MELFLFQNCSPFTDAEWEQRRCPNLLLGAFGVTTGIIYLLAYIPCLIVMLKRELIMHSCYKLMFYLGVLDCFSILCNTVLSGMYNVFACSHFTSFQYAVTFVSLGIWCSQCLTCVVLSFNRCVELWRIKFLLALFSRHRTCYWIGLCALYLAIVGFVDRGLFCSSAWFFDPYFGVGKAGVARTQHTNGMYTLNNIGVIVLLSILNAALLNSLYWKSRGRSSTYLSRLQRRITMQTFLVCLIKFSAASVYVYVQFFPVPVGLVVVGEAVWNLNAGLTPFAHLFLDPTIRQSVAELMQPGIVGQIHRICFSYSSPERQPIESTATIRFSNGNVKCDFV